MLCGVSPYPIYQAININTLQLFVLMMSCRTYIEETIRSSTQVKLVKIQFIIRLQPFFFEEKKIQCCFHAVD